MANKGIVAKSNRKYFAIRERALLLLQTLILISHSVLKLFTGFAVAALNVLTHSIKSAIKNIITPPAKNIHQLKLVLYAKFCSHVFAPYHAIGIAMMNATAISFKKSFDSNITICVAV